MRTVSLQLDVDVPSDLRRQWHDRGLVALAEDVQHPVAVHQVEVVDVGAAGLIDPQPEGWGGRSAASAPAPGALPAPR